MPGVFQKTILLVGLIFGVVLIGDLWICNKPIFAEDSAVTLSTDKSEYGQGDTVKIIVKNGLDQSIWRFNACGGIPLWGLQKMTDGVWKSLDFCLPLRNGKDDGVCERVLCERTDPKELKQKSEIEDEWRIAFFCDFVNSAGFLFEEPEKKIVEKGRYRLTFSYSVDAPAEDPYDLVNQETVYSNEFTIK